MLTISCLVLFCGKGLFCFFDDRATALTPPRGVGRVLGGGWAFDGTYFLIASGDIAFGTSWACGISDGHSDVMFFRPVSERLGVS